MNPISNRARIFEISAVLLTVLGKFLFMDYLNWKLPFIAAVIVFWAFYVLKRRKKVPINSTMSFFMGLEFE